MRLRQRYAMILVLAGLTFLSAVSSGPMAVAEPDSPENDGGPKISWENKTITFGKVITGTKVRRDITFTNSGNSPLTIQRVKPSPPPPPSSPSASLGWRRGGVPAEPLRGSASW